MDGMGNYVKCPACGEDHPIDKKYVAFENIEEDFQGRDVVTFVCITHPGQSQKSLVYGKR
jgi:hypothetical protein